MLVGVAVVAATTPGLTPVPSSVARNTAPPVAPHGYLVSIEELRERAALASRGVAPYEEAVAELLQWADGAIDDPSSPVQPLVVEGTDNPFVDDARRAYGLGLAYGLTGDERYAAAARRTIRAWVDVSVTTSDTCPDNGGCHTSLIIGRAAPGFVFGADLIDGSTSWTPEDRDRLTAWLRDAIIPAASERVNNWGDAGTFLRVVGTDYIGDTKGFEAAIDKWRSLIDLIEADGRIPEEVRRGSAGISYTQEALQYKVAVARIAERRGIDLWDFEGEAGGSLRLALDRLAHYWFRPEEWPDFPRADIPTAGPVWEIAYAHWQEPSWIPMVLERRPYGDRGHSAIRWTTVTNGVPIDADIATGSSPSAPASGAAGASPGASPASPIDPGPPVAGLSVRLGTALGNPIPVTIAWKARADTTFRLERSTDGSTWDGVDLERNGRSATVSLRPGTTYEFRVRGTRAGQVGPWTTLSGVRVVRIEPSRRTGDTSGRWESVPVGAYS
ncbi:MAG TPA: alginate lyase family protein, partial [Candidatus Limnocylindrales bacterium]|nr:alginate lyase family protein [Candidatus Limnocylindrales bacterium]